MTKDTRTIRQKATWKRGELLGKTTNIRNMLEMLIESPMISVSERSSLASAFGAIERTLYLWEKDYVRNRSEEELKTALKNKG